jgi:hypothetical protein
MARPRATLAALLSASLLTQAGLGRAQSPAPNPSAADATAASSLAPKVELEGPEAEAKERARTLFQRGVAAYRDGAFYDAVAIFLDTQRVYPDTQLCFNIARAYENLGNASAALRYYRDYLRQADRPSDGEEVRERVRKLEQRLADRGAQQLTVISQPEAATVMLDGKPVGIAPWTGETYPGKHRLALRLDRHVPQEEIIDVDAYAARDFTVTLVPEPPRPVQPTRPVAPEREPPGVRMGSLVTLGIGAALLGTALVAQTASKESGMSSPAAFFAGSGLGVASVGGIMLYFDLSPSPVATSRKDSATLRP